MTLPSDIEDISTVRLTDISAEEVYAAADPSYANCMVCSVNPTGRCSICDDRICKDHTKSLLGPRCPLCYAIDLVWQRRRIIDLVRRVTAAATGATLRKRPYDR
jgi:hypothetical protein